MKAAQASYSKRVKILPELRHILTSKRSKILFQEKTEINVLYEFICMNLYIIIALDCLYKKRGEKVNVRALWQQMALDGAS